MSADETLSTEGVASPRETLTRYDITTAQPHWGGGSAEGVSPPLAEEWQTMSDGSRRCAACRVLKGERHEPLCQFRGEDVQADNDRLEWENAGLQAKLSSQAANEETILNLRNTAIGREKLVKMQAARIAELEAAGRDGGVSRHRCSGCGHRWDDITEGFQLHGAELCGDCWRTAQPMLHGDGGVSPDLKESQ